MWVRVVVEIGARAMAVESAVTAGEVCGVGGQ